ncbi:MAG: GHKL domain-containing protein [bacterium]|nr:GHKL domain-containing protein [bacterium]
MNLITTILANCILVSSMFYIFSSFLNKKINFKNYKIYLSFIIVMLVTILSYFYVNDFIKVLIVVISFSFVLIYLFNEGYKSSIVLSIFYEFIIVISETIFAIIIIILFNMDSTKIVETQFGSLVANLSIAVISIFISKCVFIKKIFIFIINQIEKVNERLIIVLSFSVILIVNILEATLYYDLSFGYLLIFNVCIILFCFFVTFYSFKINNNYNKIYKKYNTTLNILKEYEIVMDNYKILNHENKNKLLTIRSLISKNNKKALSFIDAILQTKLSNDEKIMEEVSYIPEGGLRGLIYTKLLTMKQKHIYYKLNISKSINVSDIIGIDDLLMIDICQIIGVYIDNAIDEIDRINSGMIGIDMYEKNKTLYISISNNYKGDIEIHKIETKGYSLKGTDRGYGLSLAKNIIDNNKLISNQKNISKDIFTQMLKIKM